MRRIVLSLAVLAATASICSAQADPTIERGRQAFTERKCGACHQVAGVGNKNGPLDGVGSKLSSADIRAWITDAPAMTIKTKAQRKPPMRAFTLPADELDAVVAYLVSLKTK